MWIDQQWLAERIDYEAWRGGGYPAVALLAVGSIGFCYATLAGVMRRRGISVVLTICFCALAMVMALSASFIRAQDFGLPLFALLLGLRRPAAACALLALFAALMPLITPYGVHIVAYYRDLLGNPAVAAAAPENRPPSLLAPSSLLFFVPLLLVAVLVVRSVVKRVPLAWVPVAAVAISGAATIIASRNVVWFGMAAAVLLADMTRTWLPTQPPTRRFLAITTGVAVAIAAVGGGTLLTRTNAQYEALTPVSAIGAAAAYADAHPCVRILADNAASSALLWHEPQLAGRVAYDARLERYPPSALHRWINFQLGQGALWRETTTGYALLIGSSIYNPTLAGRLARLPGASVLADDVQGIAVVNRNVAPDPSPSSRSCPR